MAAKKKAPRNAERDNITKANQDAFLVAFGEVGTIRAAASAASIGRSTITGWLKKDVFNFKLKYDTAQEVWRESLQDMAFSRAQAQKPNDNPVLLITLLNAAWPERYRRTSYLADDAGREVMIEWKKWLKDQKGKPASTPQQDAEEEEHRKAIDEVEKILNRRKSAGNDSAG